MLTEIFGVVAPILIIAGIGFALEKSKTGLQSETLSTLTMMIGTPALVFSALTSTELSDQAIVRMALSALAAVVIGAALSAIVLRILRLPFHTYLPSLTMPNSGNIGLPCVFLAFGDNGLAIGVSFFFVIALLQYTVMPILSEGSFSLVRTVRQPLVWSVVAVIAFKLTGAAPPAIVADTTRILGGMMIPVMVILLGGSLARLEIGDVRQSVTLAFWRLGIGVTVGALLAVLFGANGVESGSLFLLASMPTAIVTYVFAQRFERSPEQVAGLVVASTMLTFAVLPALLWIALRIAAGDPLLAGLLSFVI